MRKGSFILLLMMCFAMGASATEIGAADSTKPAPAAVPPKPEKVNQHYLSLNATFFLKQLLTFTNGAVTVTASPYIFEYKMLHKKQGFRIGLGGNLNNSKTTNDQNQVTVKKASTFDIRAGYVYQSSLGKRWAYFAGVDVTGQSAKSTSTDNTAVDVLTTKNDGYTVGFGPSFGIQFNISNRVGLFTESAIYYAYNHQSTNVTSSNFPSLNTSSTTIGNSIQFVIPTSIYFFVRL